MSSKEFSTKNVYGVNVRYCDNFNKAFSQGELIQQDYPVGIFLSDKYLIRMVHVEGLRLFLESKLEEKNYLNLSLRLPTGIILDYIDSFWVHDGYGNYFTLIFHKFEGQFLDQLETITSNEYINLLRWLYASLVKLHQLDLIFQHISDKYILCGEAMKEFRWTNLVMKGSTSSDDKIQNVREFNTLFLSLKEKMSDPGEYLNFLDPILKSEDLSASQILEKIF